MLVILIFVLLLFLYLGLIAGRSGHQGLAELRKYHYAHRGLHGNGVPENSMEAFRLAKEHGYGIELDVHLMKDGKLAVIHDASLLRTTGQDGFIEDLTEEMLSQYHLEGTNEAIPMFSQVLELYDGAAPLIVELKAERKNHAALSEAACDLLKNYNGNYCIESFDPRCILWLKKNRPEIIRGQLSQNFFKGNEKLSPLLKFLMSQNLLNFLTKPDFLAYRFEHRRDTPSLFICRKLLKMQCVAWTIRDQKNHREAVGCGWLSIFESFIPDE